MFLQLLEDHLQTIRQLPTHELSTLNVFSSTYHMYNEDILELIKYVQDNESNLTPFENVYLAYMIVSTGNNRYDRKILSFIDNSLHYKKYTETSVMIFSMTDNKVGNLYRLVRPAEFEAKVVLDKLNILYNL